MKKNNIHRKIFPKIQMAVSTSATCSIRTMYPWHRINCGDIVIGNEIGSGSFGSVYEAVCFGRVRVAAKKVSLKSNRFVNLWVYQIISHAKLCNELWFSTVREQILSRIKKEADIHSALSHPGIVPFLGHSGIGALYFDMLQ